MHQAVKGNKLGEYFVASTTPEVAKEFTVVAITRADNPANGMYQTQGFRFTDEYVDQKTGVAYKIMKMDKISQINEDQYLEAA